MSLDFFWRHDTRHNDIQRNNTQHNNINDTEHNDKGLDAGCRIFYGYADVIMLNVINAECHYC
jgi:hypothetical protein